MYSLTPRVGPRCHYQTQFVLRLDLLFVTRAMVKIHICLVPLHKTVVYDVKASDTIGNIKAKIEKEEKIPAVLQDFSINTCELEDAFTLKDYNLHILTQEEWKTNNMLVNVHDRFPEDFKPKKRRTSSEGW